MTNLRWSRSALSWLVRNCCKTWCNSWWRSCARSWYSATVSSRAAKLSSLSASSACSCWQAPALSSASGRSRASAASSAPRSSRRPRPRRCDSWSSVFKPSTSCHSSRRPPLPPSAAPPPPPPVRASGSALLAATSTCSSPNSSWHVLRACLTTELASARCSHPACARCTADWICSCISAVSRWWRRSSARASASNSLTSARR
mmetsp:Transcript_178427/g.571717  ORF Transcript_178427/g.571717 Transcript_178427/m.571717 type:complete len:203 (+) Transcript_178427:372-980(+)